MPACLSTYLNASERTGHTRTYPNISEGIQTYPNASKQHAGNSKNTIFPEFRIPPAHLSVAIAVAVAVAVGPVRTGRRIGSFLLLVV